MIEGITVEKVNAALTSLCRKIQEREHRAPISFADFLKLVSDKPDIILRDIFQIFHDMIYSYIVEGINEYPTDPESIDYVDYDCSKLFEEGCDHPFFADRLFANRLINLVASFRHGIQQNRIYIFQGPHGCGKSIFLNNLLMKFEQYSKTEEGASYETVWKLNKEELGLLPEDDAQSILSQLHRMVDDTEHITNEHYGDNLFSLPHTAYVEVPCPSHDHPFLLIPKSYRRDVLNDLIEDEDFKQRLFTEKQYEWLFKANPCTICMSLYQTMLDTFDSPSKVYDMIFARRYHFNKRLGEGISVYNPGDGVPKTNVLTNQLLQNLLNRLLKDSNRVRYIFSRYARTNNGIYALMDVKANNRERFANLHGLISEGVHKVEDIEENVNSLFLALMNPEDDESIVDAESFSDRKTVIKIPYILDYTTEVKIYRNIFGDHIEKHFLPRVLENFAKVIISSRLNTKSEGLLEWIGNPKRYSLYCDGNLQLLKMDIYTGLIPLWLNEEDRKQFKAKRRRRIIAESEKEGGKGISGRDSIKIFNEFYSSHVKNGNLITMAMVYSFFNNLRKDLAKSIPIPDGFLDSLIQFYDYTVLQEVKESLYYYNEERISRDIQNYLFGINFEIGQVERCVYTGDELEITDGFFEGIERRLLGSNLNEAKKIAFRRDIQNQYASKTLTQELMLDGKGICETEVYQLLHERYVHNLKERVMDPFLKNDNFRRAIKDYDTELFKTYDRRIRAEVHFLMENLNKKYGYTEQGAKEVCIYVVDNDLAKKFSENAT